MPTWTEWWAAVIDLTWNIKFLFLMLLFLLLQAELELVLQALTERRERKR